MTADEVTTLAVVGLVLATAGCLWGALRAWTVVDRFAEKIVQADVRARAWRARALTAEAALYTLRTMRPAKRSHLETTAPQARVVDGMAAYDGWATLPRTERREP